MNDRFSPLSRLFLFLTVAALPGFSIAQVSESTLPPIDSLSDWQVNAYVNTIVAQAANLEKTLAEQAGYAQALLAEKEAEYQRAKEDTTLSKETLQGINADFKASKKTAKVASRNHKKGINLLDFAQKTAAADSLVQRKNLVKLWRETQKLQSIVYPPAAEVPGDKVTSEVVEEVHAVETEMPAASEMEVSEAAAKPASKPQKATVRTKKYDPEADVMLNPPKLPCTMAVSTRDEFTGELFRRCTAVELFRHSPAVLKNFLQGKPNVLCEAALASAGAKPILYLTFTIVDPNARKAFGKVDKDSPLTMLFLDGSTLVLNNQQVSEGLLNPDTQVYTCRMQYDLSQEAIKKISREELDRIRVIWSSGFEDYDVQYVQLLMQQSKCLFD